MRALSLISALLLVSQVVGNLSSSSLEKHVDTLTLSSSFKPIIPSYWTGFPHHRRTPFALSPDGNTAYLAYLDSSGTGVHVQAVNPLTFASAGSPVTINGKEAGGLVAHNDGFALLTNEVMPSGTTNAPPGSTPVPVLYRYTNGQQTFKTWLAGPNVHPSDGLSMAPDLNGDLVFSEAAGLYGAYFVVTDYQGPPAGHFGDSVEYVSTDGTLQSIAASSSWGCSHNTGIAFEAADAPPFASICAEDHGAIWLNTETRGMSGVKISNENVQNGASNEPMGGMSGSYSGLARFIDANSYIFAWVSRGAIDLTQDTWMGTGYTQAANRTNNRNVAVATFSDKNTLNGPQAISTVGAASGDSQVNWITQGTSDTSNAHVAAFNSTTALITWEEAANPSCPFIAMGCSGVFTGTYFQLVDSTGTHIGSPISSTDTYVAGDMVTFPDGKICWPYVNMAWSLMANADNTVTSSKISFACMSNGAGTTSGSASTSGFSSSTTSSSRSTVASSSTATWTTSKNGLSITGSATAVTQDVSMTSSATGSTRSIVSSNSSTSFDICTVVGVGSPSTPTSTLSSMSVSSVVSWTTNPTTLLTTTTTTPKGLTVNPSSQPLSSASSTGKIATTTAWPTSGAPGAEIELICWTTRPNGRGKLIYNCEAQ